MVCAVDVGPAIESPTIRSNQLCELLGLDESYYGKGAALVSFQGIQDR